MEILWDFMGIPPDKMEVAGKIIGGYESTGKSSTNSLIDVLMGHPLDRWLVEGKSSSSKFAGSDIAMFVTRG